MSIAYSSSFGCILHAIGVCVINSSGRRAVEAIMHRKFWLLAAVGLCGLVLVFAGMQSVMNGQMRANKSAVAGGSMISGMGSLSGTVKAPKEFKAAKVYAHNLDKNVVYMVYTVGGKYSMTDLFPGNYEVSVIKSGFGSV